MSKDMEVTKRTENMVEKQQDLPVIAPMVDIYENDEPTNPHDKQLIVE
ncbi:hypothetical protein [Desulfosediminicola flagellatus]|nr:hypothetical protein [Desulfosediminicola flagellatus]